jgi:TetR/AcrR family transcriptional regulator, mexJK operon transcriptional repressor
MANAKPKPRERVIEAGKRLFFNQGFKAISTDALANEAAVSKATLYKYFPNMTAVLEAVVEAEVAVFEHGVPAAFSTRAEFRAALIHYGVNLLMFLNKQQTIQFAQLMFEEARTRPDLAKTFYDAAYAKTVNDLGRIIGKGLDQGFVVSDLQANELAEQLLGMWEGFRFVRAQLGLTNKPFSSPRAWADQGVKTLLGE